MPNPSSASNPEEKAARAAEELVAEGKPITARAVRERAGVSTRVLPRTRRALCCRPRRATRTGN